MAYANREQQRQCQRQWTAKRRREWLAAHGPCVKCGSPDELEVDHIDPAQKVDHRIWSWAEPRMLAELAKCQVLCRRCHLAKTLASRTQRQHGTLTMYQRERCRCEPCREAKRTESLRYRLKRR
jgi:5-methylcytosine-specific restriction endonuclease McrA